MDESKKNDLDTGQANDAKCVNATKGNVSVIDEKVNGVTRKIITETFDFYFNGYLVQGALIKGEPWLRADQVCAALGLGNSRKALIALEDDEKANVTISDTSPSSRKTVTVSFVNEPGVYSLIFRSRKPEAKKFKRWVLHEVLPQIRKNGGFAVGVSITPDLLNDVKDIKDRLENLEKATHESLVYQKEDRLVLLEKYRKKGRPLSNSEKYKIERLYGEGEPVDLISYEIGRSPSTVRRYLRRYSYAYRRRS